MVARTALHNCSRPPLLLKPRIWVTANLNSFPGEKKMSKMTGTAKSVLFASLCALFTVSLPAQAADNFLADRHKAKGLSCQMCHGPDANNPQTPTIETCTTCHQKDALVKKTRKGQAHQSARFSALRQGLGVHELPYGSYGTRKLLQSVPPV